MSNPFSVASVATWPIGPGQSPDNLTALPNGSALGLGKVGAARVQYYDDLVAPIQIKSGGAGVSATGTASLYLVLSEDGVLFSGGVNPNAATDQSSGLSADMLIETIEVTADATLYYFKEFSIQQYLGFMPSFWALVVRNQSGAAFDSTAANFSAKHSLVSYA